MCCVVVGPITALPLNQKNLLVSAATYLRRVAKKSPLRNCAFRRVMLIIDNIATLIGRTNIHYGASMVHRSGPNFSQPNTVSLQRRDAVNARNQNLNLTAKALDPSVKPRSGCLQVGGLSLT